MFLQEPFYHNFRYKLIHNLKEFQRAHAILVVHVTVVIDVPHVRVRVEGPIVAFPYIYINYIYTIVLEGQLQRVLHLDLLDFR